MNLSELMKKKTIVGTIGAATIAVAGAGLWSVILTPTSSVAQSRPAASAVEAAPVSASPNARVALPDFADLVEKVSPSVVKIRTTAKVGERSAQPGMDGDMQEFFRRFFGVPVPNMPSPQNPSPQQDDEESRTRGVGSGFIYTQDGYIMTNAHVVEDADEIFVTLTDKREVKAKLIGADKRTDVAIVKIDLKNLPAVQIANVDKVRVGEWVIAIGSPFGLESTVTAGIVSAKARETGDFVPFIQTDVAINPGNSGGPLLNMKGEVIGINSQIYSRSGGYMGISFAIPMDEASRVAEQLRSTGRVIRGRIGVGITDISSDVAESMNLPKPTGAQVTMVEPGSPSEKAGLEAGDLILRVDGRTVEKAEDLRRMIGNTKPGSTVKLTLLRRGSEKQVTVSVAELEPDQKDQAAKSTTPQDDGSTTAKSLGLNVRDLTEAQKRELKVRGGVLVKDVSGPAARAGLRSGDVILQLGNQTTNTVKEFESASKQMDKSKPVSVLFRRGEWAQYATIRPSAQ